MQRLKAIIAVVLACALPASAAAQAAGSIAVGDRIRVSVAGGPVQTGRVTSVDNASIGVQPEGAAAPVSITRSTMKRIEISRGKMTKGQAAWRGAKRWGLISGGIGAISLGLQHEEVGENGSSFGKAAALGAWSGALFGGLIGAAVGAGRAGERWEQVWP